MEKGNKVNKSQLKKLFARSEVTVIAAVLALGIIFTAFSDSFLPPIIYSTWAERLQSIYLLQLGRPWL